MIINNEIKSLVSSWGLAEHVIEKDYCLGWALSGIAGHPELKEQWVFKGGTCLKKCYIETYRFSEDLDFTVLDPKYTDINVLRDVFKNITAKLESDSGIRFNAREPVFTQRKDPLCVEGKLYYTGPRNTPHEASIKLDLSASEKIVDTPVYNEISHPYSDAQEVLSYRVKCYSFNELFAEKIRAMGERCRPRDLYDIINLYRREDFKKQPAEIHRLLGEKCAVKGIPMISLRTIHSSEFKDEIISSWEHMLGHQLPVLPPFEKFWEELPDLFNWLEGSKTPALLPSMPVTNAEDVPPHYTGYTSTSEKYYGFSLEAVRFAAVNRLYIRLGYDNKQRLIEPYSLRSSKDGNILLCAVKENGDSRTYRVDRIQTVEVTNRPFSPKYAVEFPAAGRVAAPRIFREVKTGFGGGDLWSVKRRKRK